eukprot:scaffold504_cov189-Ochromonas_danica.AAC.13
MMRGVSQEEQKMAEVHQGRRFPAEQNRMKRTEMVSINNVEPCDDSRVHPNTAEQDNRSSPATATANSTATATAGLFRGPRPKNQWTDNLFNLARHLYGYKKRLDGDADPERPDNYETPKDADLV